MEEKENDYSSHRQGSFIKPHTPLSNYERGKGF